MPNDLQNRIREVLREQADTQPFVPSEARVTAKQAKRRLVRNGVGAGVLAAVVLLGAVGAIGSVLNANGPKPESSPSSGVLAPDEMAYYQQGRNQGEYVVDKQGETRLISRLGASAGWFPDGRSLLIYSGGERARTLQRVSVDTGNVIALPLSNAPAAVQLDGWMVNQPDLSPDGTRLAMAAFRSPTNGGRGLYVTDLRGGHPREIYRGDAYEPAWSPDGTEIAFSGSIDGQTGQILVVDVDTGGLHALPLPRGTRDAGYPAWSPDGSWIAMDAELAGLWIVHPDGSGLSALTPPLSGSEPSWAPDGRSIAYETDYGVQDGPTDIRSVDLASGEISTLVGRRGSQLLPLWRLSLAT